MAYANQFVASIIYKNQPQREFKKDGTRAVQLPFDSEYSVRVQNKTGLRASVDVLIDGISIFSAGKTLQLAAGQTTDLERFVSDMKSGSRFKFVSLAKAIAEGHQDPSSRDFGVIEFKFVPEKALSLLRGSTLSSAGAGSPMPRNHNYFLRSKGVDFSADPLFSSTIAYAGDLGLGAVTNCTAVPEVNASVIGGTVEGSESKQEFSLSKDIVAWDYSNATTIKIRLIGESNEDQPFPKEVIMDNKTVVFQWANRNPDGSVTVCYK